METLFKPLIFSVRHPSKAAQEMGGKTLATLGKVHTLKTMEAVIVDLLPLLGDTKSVNNRFGAALALHRILLQFIYIYIFVFLKNTFFFFKKKGLF